MMFNQETVDFRQEPGSTRGVIIAFYYQDWARYEDGHPRSHEGGASRADHATHAKTSMKSELNTAPNGERATSHGTVPH
jgi:hypothetical protein